MKKKLLVVFITLCLAVVSMTIVTCAEKVEGSGWTFDTDSGELCFNEGSLESAAKWIEKKDDYNYASQVKTVVFGENVTEIASNLLLGCTNLTSVTINGDVTSIGAYAFYGCSSLTSINIPSSVKTIGDDAFNGCNRLTSIGSLSSVEIIGIDAFSGTGLASVTLGCGTSYDSHSFPSGCTVIQPDHTYSNGVCTVCGADDPNCISIAGTKLSDGNSYSGTTGTATYKDGVLTLNNFTLGVDDDIPAIYSEHELTIKISSTNTISASHSYVILVEDSLIIVGDDSATLEVLSRGGYSIFAGDNVFTVQPANGTILEVQTGTTTAYCSSATEIDNINEYVTIKPHTHSYSTVVTSPTCTEGGYTTYTCACGDSYTADEAEATGHAAGEAVVENEVLATCTEDGSYDSVVYCSVCNTELSRETVTVEATGHTYVDGVCSVCGAEDPDYVKVTSVTIDGEHALAEILPSGLVTSVTISVDSGEISVGTVDGEHKLEAIADAMGFTLYNDSHGEWLLKNTEEFLIRENSRIRKVTALFYGDIDFESGATVTMSFETTSSALSSATIHVVHYTNGAWKEETSSSTYQEGNLTVTFQPDSSSPFLVLAVTDYNSSSRDNPLPLLLQIGALNQSTTTEDTTEGTTEEVVEIDEPVEAGETDSE